MDKFVYFTDPHLRKDTPRSRVDDYRGAILKKFKWIVRFCVKNGVKKILFGGDLLNSPTVGDKTINMFIHIFNDAYIKHGIMLFAVLGNHDIVGKRVETYKDGKHFSMDKYPWYNLFLTNNHRFDFKNTVVVGIDYNKSLETPDSVVLPIDKPIGNKILIVILHSMIWGKDKSKIINGKKVIISYNDVFVTPVPDVVLSGHYHPGFKKRVKFELEEKTIFANPGSLGRTSSDLLNGSVCPSICYIRVKKNKQVKISYKKVPVNDKAFDLDFVESFGDVICAEQFVEAVKKYKNVKANSDDQIRDLLYLMVNNEKDFGIDFKVTTELVDGILEKVKEVQKNGKS